MSLIKDGTVYRTVEEQVGHLTDAHNSQLTINSNVSNRLNALEANAAIGGYNYVRFAFERSGTYYYIATTKFTVETEGAVNDYVEISSYNKNDIPAYGYYVDTNTIELVFTGDFISEYETLTVKNVTQNTTFTITPTYGAFSGTWLLQYDPNEKKKQLFTVLTDLAYAEATTKYASFDFNNDGIYNYVFIGLSQAGVDGYNVYTVTNDNISTVIAALNINDSVIFTENNQTSYIDNTAVIGDVYTLTATNTYTKKGNIRGEKGEQGDKGEQGEQGIQGVQGIQGIQGEKGEKGDTGATGASGLIINTGIKSSASDLPTFSETEEGDAYVVLNSSGSSITYDLYYHAKDGTDWDILSNWGGVKGDKGDKGDTGETGAQGVQGEQGEAGIAATISIGTVTTGEAGSSASVTNSGTENAAILDFVIPKGDTGETGAQGENAAKTNTIHIDVTNKRTGIFIYFDINGIKQLARLSDDGKDTNYTFTILAGTPIFFQELDADTEFIAENHLVICTGADYSGNWDVRWVSSSIAGYVYYADIGISSDTAVGTDFYYGLS